MAVQVKICGLTSADAADAAVRAGADLAGLVFCPGSPRHLAVAQGAALATRLRGRTRIVALLVDPQDDEVASAIAAVNPDFLQLHGRETPDRVARLRTRFGRLVIKAMPVAEAADFASLQAYENVADMLLFDAKAPPGAGRTGGHGAAFDWQLLRGRIIKRPWLLAGGLDPENVARAIRAVAAPGVDVSSGVEKSPGVKDPELILAFAAAARSAQFAEAPEA
jgi:phosphoribosylanthranilate isomerase